MAVLIQNGREIRFYVFVKQDILTEYLTRLVLFGNEFKPEFQFRKSSKFWQCLHMHSPPPPRYDQNELTLSLKYIFFQTLYLKIRSDML